MARKSLCEASIASLGDIYKKCTDLVQQPCSQIPAVILGSAITVHILKSSGSISGFQGFLHLR